MKNLPTMPRMKRMFVIRLLFSLCFAVEASATDVTLRLVDQNGALILASQFQVAGVMVPQEGTISLAAGSYAFRLFPGLNGSVQGSLLHRVETVSISGATQTVEFTWVTAALQVNIVDQNNVPIPASQFLIRSATTELPNGVSVTLPVTDDPSSSTISGTLEAGYVARLLPGLNGQIHGGLLYREDQIELGVGGVVQSFTWVTAPLQVNIVDQNNVPIPASQFLVRSATTELPNGASIILPVTEDPNTSTIFGTLEAGYVARLFPGLNGQPQVALLYREEQVELTASGLADMFIWEIASGSLHVVDALENEVSGASINQSFVGTISTGAFVSLPVTDNNLYPSIASTYASGYSGFSIQTAPSNVFAGPFTFELLSNEIFDPAFVLIDGAQYGLRFDLQSMPVCVNPPSGLVSWWPGDDNANDIKGSNHGALQNGATFATGKVGQTFSFDGVDDAALIADNASLRVSSFTIDAWINTADAILIQPIIAKAQASGNWLSYMLRIQDGGKLALILENSAENRSVHWRTLSTLSSNRWYHVAGTWQNLNGDNTDAKIYVDGVEQAIEMSFNINGYSSTFLPGYTTEPLFIGRDEYPSGYFKGYIDEVEIFDRVLSAAEVQSLYTAGSAGKCKECTPPDVSITGDESVCPNTTHTYAANTDAANPTFEWSVTGGTIDGDNTGSSVSVIAGGAGTMTVSVQVTDGTTNCSNSVTQNVTVEDNQKPVITVNANPITLWPPNHQYITVNVSQCVTTVTDNCAMLSTNNVIITKVTSDEPEDAKGGGDGNTLNDMVIASNCQSVQLRSEREGSGNGRVYTIHFSVNDGNGNTGTATCLVTVPKSQNGNPAVNDGPVYTVNGSCSGSSAKLAGVSSDENAETMTLPESYALEQNYPNPFNPSTVIGFQLPVNSEVKLAIYSLTGQLVRELVNGEMNAGRHAISWDGRDHIGNTVAAGMYLYRFVARGENGEVVFAQTLRMAFLK